MDYFQPRYYQFSPKKNPVNDDPDFGGLGRVVRGRQTHTNRDHYDPNTKKTTQGLGFLGFRCAREIK